MEVVFERNSGTHVEVEATVRSGKLRVLRRPQMRSAGGSRICEGDAALPLDKRLIVQPVSRRWKAS